MLHGRAGDDHAVVALGLDLVEGGVEFQQVLLRRVFRGVGRGLHQLDLNLQRCVREAAQKLGLRHGLVGHQVENQDFERADVLMQRAVLGHHEDVLVFEHGSCRQRIGMVIGMSKNPFLRRRNKTEPPAAGIGDS